MLNIYIPKEPQLTDYGISENEIPKIESFVIKPIKRGKKRTDILFNYSIFVFYIVAYSLIVFFLYLKNGWYIDKGYSILYTAIVITICYSLTFFVPLLGIGITNYILNLIIPNSLVHDTKDKYDNMTINMMDKKAELKQYQSAVKQYICDMERIKKEYPMADSVFPISMKDKDSRYPNHFRNYIKMIIKESFIQKLKANVAKVDEQEENRSSLKWWENLSPFDFESEVGKWYMSKGYTADVTKHSSDGGIDVILKKNGEITYVQCKQWNDLVPVGVVRELFGVMASRGVKKGIVVCLKGGTKGAYDFANENGIRIVTHHDFVKETNHIRRTYTSKDIGFYWQYGDYYVLYDGWKNVEDAITTIEATNYTSRSFFVGLCKWESFYLGVAMSMDINHSLPCFDYIYDAKNNKIIYQRMPSITSTSTYRPYNKRRRGRYNRKYWY